MAFFLLWLLFLRSVAEQQHPLHAFARRYASWRIYRELTDDDPDNDTTHSKRKTYCNVLGSALQLLPTLLAILLVYDSRDFFNAIVDKACTDEQTLEPFEFLADNASTVLYINIAKIVFGFLYLLYRFLRLTVCAKKSHD